MSKYNLSRRRPTPPFAGHPLPGGLSSAMVQLARKLRRSLRKETNRGTRKIRGTPNPPACLSAYSGYSAVYYFGCTTKSNLLAGCEGFPLRTRLSAPIRSPASPPPRPADCGPGPPRPSHQTKRTRAAALADYDQISPIMSKYNLSRRRRRTLGHGPRTVDCGLWTALRFCTISALFSPHFLACAFHNSLCHNHFRICPSPHGAIPRRFHFILYPFPMIAPAAVSLPRHH